MKSTALIFLTVLPAISIANTNSLCLKTEKIFFNCSTPTGKLISVCGSTELSESRGYLQYRIGRKNTPAELVYPQNLIHPRGSFSFGSASFGAKSGGTNLRFKIAEFEYTVFYSSGAFDGISAGVFSKTGADKPRYTSCKFEEQQRNFYLLGYLNLTAIDREDIVY